MNRADFIIKLGHELANLGLSVEDRTEILEDFGRHFDQGKVDGLSEAEVCAKLGDPSEIAPQYAGENPDYVKNAKTGTVELKLDPVFPIPAIGLSEPAANGGFANDYAKSDTFRKESDKASYFNIGGLIAIICLDVFVLSWALPSLFACVFAYYVSVLTFIVSGLTCVIGSVFVPVIIQTSLSMASVFFLGIALMSLGALGVLGGIAIAKGCSKIVKGVINLHTMWTVNRKVFDNKEALT